MNKCPTNYVVGLYSTFASRFDTLLVEKLQYQTPTLLRHMVDEVQSLSSSASSHPFLFHHVCDLGCGTGLSGLAFQDKIHGTLIGIDLSPEMLQRAQQRGCYTQLFEGDIETTLLSLVRPHPQEPKEEQPSSTATSPEEDQTPNHNDGNNKKNNSISFGGFDLILACDVFCYIGDLTSIFHVISTRALAPGGYFVFSTEWLAAPEGNKDRTGPPFALHACARFAHQQGYIESLAQTHHFKVVQIKVAPLRQNQGKPVLGLLVVLQLATDSQNSQ